MRYVNDIDRQIRVNFVQFVLLNCHIGDNNDDDHYKISGLRDTRSTSNFFFFKKWLMGVCVRYQRFNLTNSMRSFIILGPKPDARIFPSDTIQTVNRLVCSFYRNLRNFFYANPYISVYFIQVYLCIDYEKKTQKRSHNIGLFLWVFVWFQFFFVWVSYQKKKSLDRELVMEMTIALSFL